MNHTADRFGVRRIQLATLSVHDGHRMPSARGGLGLLEAGQTLGGSPHGRAAAVVSAWSTGISAAAPAGMVLGALAPRPSRACVAAGDRGRGRRTRCL